jgi:hypothetical protein
MQAWVPAIALWLWHTLAAGRRPRGAPLDMGAVWTQLTGVASRPSDRLVEAIDVPADGNPPADAGQSQERNRHARVPARAEVRRLLRRQRGALTDDQVARLAVLVAGRAGVSIPRARRLLREERQPRVVDGATEVER